MSRAQRRIVQALRPPAPPSARVWTAVGRIVSVAGSVATIYLNEDTETPVPGVPLAPGVTVAAGQTVELTFTGRSPVITRRIT